MARRPRKVAPPLDIRDVLTIKHDRVFLCCDRYGDIPKGNTAALGLYYKDTRFLCQLELTVDRKRPLFLHAEADRNYSMIVETTLPVAIMDPKGVPTTDNVSVSRHRWLEDGLHEEIRIRNYSLNKRRVRVDLSFDADFLDLFEVRGSRRAAVGEMLEPEISESAVTFAYEGLDGVKRAMDVEFDPAPNVLRAGRATYTLKLDPQETATVTVRMRPKVAGKSPSELSLDYCERAYAEWKKSCTRLSVSHPQFQAFLNRAVLDIEMMQTRGDDGLPSIDAGVPWFSALFGRDSLITAYMTLGLNPDLAKGTLLRLAELQGEKIDDERDEEPGKILHELRVGEMAANKEIPHTPYYGTIDATPLWLILYGYVWQWTADREFAERLWPNAERALRWIDEYGDRDGDGYVEYQKKTPKGLDNQGWKDSHDGILHADGTKPEGPLALVEVQGYVYDAKLRTARVARALGHDDLADDLEDQAAGLGRRFNEDFWMPSHRYYAVGLDGNKQQIASVTSNPGHALWSGIIDHDRARHVARRLVSSEMHSGWGIRTLSAKNPGFDPIGYHTGTVWPHDNALIAHGLTIYGFESEANKVMSALTLAGAFFRDARFPELFCGFSREEAAIPVEYPVACRPQAWASAAPLLMMRSYAGMHAQAHKQQLSIVRPSIPAPITRVDLVGMRVGDTRLDLSFLQHGGMTAVNVMRKDGAALDVVVRY